VTPGIDEGGVLPRAAPKPEAEAASSSRKRVSADAHPRNKNPRRTLAALRPNAACSGPRISYLIAPRCGDPAARTGGSTSMRSVLAALAMVGAGVLAIQAPAMAADAANGQKVFRQCQACHVANQEQNRVGPHLVGIIGRPAGAVDGFKYSDAMANSGIVWDQTTIAEYLANPRGYVNGNRMAFTGLRKPEDIADVIAYLESLDS
jgi:cytochrome c